MFRLSVMLLATALGIATTLGIAWAIAAWMPFESYPRQTAHYFVAGGRPWSAVVRSSRGVHSIWWDEIDIDSYSVPGQRGSDNRWPSTSEGWVEFAIGKDWWRNRFEPVALQLEPSIHPPAWGTFAAGGVLVGIDAGQDCAFGWPYPALWYQVTGTIASNTATASGLHGGLILTQPLDIRGYDFRALPLRPVWWGLAGNALLYGVLWWTVLVTPRAARRALRTRTGRCPDCGYARGGLPPGSPCPECGRREAQGGG